MIDALLLCAVMAAGMPTDETPVKQADLQAYTAAKAKAGKNPDAQVKLALWCEAHGLSAERTKHLILATLLDPANAAARGLLGVVSYQGKWQAPANVARSVQQDPARAALINEYLQRRSRTPDKPEAQWKLALWCDEHGLKDQASAHFYQVLRRDPRREAVWKRLGFKKLGSHWVKPELLAAEKAEALTQARAAKYWLPRLEKWRDALGGRDKSKKAAAEDELSRLTDPYAVPLVMTVFGRGNEAQQKLALQILGQIDSPGASRALAMLAVFSGSATIRGQATQMLRRRDVREFADFLISLVQQPIEFEVRRVQGPGSPGELFIKGQGSQPNVRRLYSPPGMPQVPSLPGDFLTVDGYGMPVIRRSVQPLSDQTINMRYDQLRNENAFIRAEAQAWGYKDPVMVTADQKQRVMQMMAQTGLGPMAQQIGQQMISAYEKSVHANGPRPLQLADWGGLTGTPSNPWTQFYFALGGSLEIPVGRMAAEVQKTAMAAEQQLEHDVAAINNYNGSLRELNERVVPVLKEVSGLDLGPTTGDWEKWYLDQLGYQSPPAKPSEPETMTEDVPLDYQPQPVPLDIVVVGPMALTKVSCFGAGTLVHTLSGPRPIQEIKIGDQVLSQNVKTGALAYNSVLLVHHNPPSRTFRVRLVDEIIVSSAFHRFWKAGQGWVMARDLAIGDQIRTLNGTVKVAKIEEGGVVPVFNLDVSTDADFFVGQRAALVHDNSLPGLRQPPFDSLGSPDRDLDTKPDHPSPPSGSSRP